MGIKFTKDNRERLWSNLERDTQRRAFHKDKRFVLSGNWKKFIKKQYGYKVYRVNGEWVRNNLSIIFGHGGHGFAHEFIPVNEIWISDKHWKNCGCNNVRKDFKMSKKYFDSTALHEIIEAKEMKKGKIFWRAHQLAVKAEIGAGILEDPYSEEY
jgi:hypothetical protein